MTYPTVAPSVLSFDFSRLEEEIQRMRDAGIKILHYDVMDGIFTPWISFGEHLFKFFKDKGFILDVHLMVVRPIEHALEFLKLGADEVTVHYEAIKNDISGFLEAIEPLRKNRVIGIAYNPETELDAASLSVLNHFDKAMVMSVHPGRSGQGYLPGSEDRLRILKDYSDQHGLNLTLEIDGGINGTTGPLAVASGAQILVSGSYLCSSKDPKATIEAILGGKTSREG